MFNLAGRLIKDLQDYRIPESTAKQKEKFENLLAAPNQICDHSNQVVLPDIDGFDLIALLLGTNVQRESKFIVAQRLSGGGASVVMESDPAWRQSVLRELLNEDDYKRAVLYLNDCIERNLPDIDIHLICKASTACLRETAAFEFVDALALRVIQGNPAYLDNQIEVLTKTLSEKKELEEHEAKLLHKLNNFQRLKYEKAAPETLNKHYRILAGLIIRRNCFKKFSINTFGTIISIGKLELVIAENPDYLTIPDQFAYNFEADCKGKTISSLEISHHTQDGKEAVLCRILKIAGLNRPANEHMLLKLCSFEAQGYCVPNLLDKEKACDAVVNYVYSSQTQKLTKEGILLLERYKTSHFASNPEEGVCAMFNLYQQLEKSRQGHLIPLIAAVMRDIDGDKKMERLLFIVQHMLTHYSKDYSVLVALLKIYSIIHLDQGAALQSEDPLGRENWILFPSKAYVLKFAFTIESALAILKDHALSGLGKAFLNLANHLRPPKKCVPLLPESISKAIVYEAMEWVRNHRLGMERPGLYLLLRCPEPEALKFLCLYLPKCLKLETQGEPRKRLLALYKESFALDGREGCITKFEQRFAFEENEAEDYLQAWMEILAEDHLWAEEAYIFWERLHSQNKMADSAGFAHRMLPTGMLWALKIICRTVCRDDSSPRHSVDALQVRLYECLLQLFEFKSQPLNSELAAAIQPAAVWLIKSLYKSNKDKAIKLCQSAPATVNILGPLAKDDFNIWPLCNGQQALGKLEELEKGESWGRMMEGIAHVFSLAGPISWKIQALSHLVRALPHIFTEKTDPFTFQKRLKLLVDVFDISKSDDEPVQKARLPLLQQALKECHHLQRSSTTLSFEQRLKELTGLLLAHPEELKFPERLEPAAFAELLIGLAKDQKSILALYAEQVLQITPFLVKALMALNRYDIVLELFSSLRAAGIPVEEGCEVQEASCIALIRELIQSEYPEERMSQLYAKLGALSEDSKAWPLLLALFKSMLAKRPPAAVELFLKHFKGLPASPEVLPYSQALLQAIQKSEKAGRHEQVFKLLKLAHDFNMAETEKVNFENSAKKLLIKYMAEDSSVRDLENAGVLSMCFPDLGIGILPALTKRAVQSPNRNLCASLFDLWNITLQRSSSKAIWTSEQYRENCLNFIKALKASSSPLIVNLLRSQLKILCYFNEPEHKDMKIELCRIWLEGCFEQVQDCNKIADPQYFTKDPSLYVEVDSYQALCALMCTYEVETLEKKDCPVRFSCQLQWMSLHAVSSRPEFVLTAWCDINSTMKAENIDEKTLNLLVPVIVKTLDRSFCLAGFKLTVGQSILLEEVSKACRSRLASKLLPSAWIAVLASLDSPIEVLEWMKLYVNALNNKNHANSLKPLSLKTIKSCLSKALKTHASNKHELIEFSKKSAKDSFEVALDGLLERNGGLWERWTLHTEYMCGLIEHVLVGLSKNGPIDDFDDIWAGWTSVKFMRCLDIESPLICFSRLIEFFNVLERYCSKGLRMFNLEDKFTKKLTALIPLSEHEIMINLWNKYLTVFFTKEKDNYKELMQVQRRFNLMMLDAKRMDPTIASFYFDLCKSFFKSLCSSMKNVPHTAEQKDLMLELCYNLLYNMIRCNLPEDKYLPINVLLYEYVGLTTPKDEMIYTKHLGYIADILSTMLDNFIAVESEFLLYKHFLMGGCLKDLHRSIVDRLGGIKANLLEDAMESILKESWDFELSEEMKIFPVIIFARSVEKDLIDSIPTFMRLLEHACKSLGDCFLKGERANYENLYSFYHEPEFKLGIQRLIQKEEQPFAWGKLFLGNILGKKLDLFNRSEFFEDKNVLFVGMLNWAAEYAELAFDVSPRGYESYYSFLEIKFLPAMCSLCENRNFMDIKPTFDKFAALFTNPKLPVMTAEGMIQRAASVKNVIDHLKSNKGLTFQVMAKTLTNRAIEQKIIFEIEKG